MRHPLVLVPGLTCTKALWKEQLAGLADVAEMTVADHTTSATLQGIAATILATAPQRFALAGLSMGGYISLEIVRQAPERVTHLALLDTTAKPFDPALRPGREALVAKAKSEGMVSVLRELLPVFIHPDRMGDQPLVDAVIQMGVDTGPIVFERQQAALMARPDSRSMLREIRVPTLALVGAEDVLTPPAEHVAIAEAVSGCTLEIIPHCGHLATMERPEAVNAAMRAWLRRAG